ncbi:MAG: TonB-dependent receptor plug domain-containing protein [Limnobacter sp.]|nr:TonB-dependent receptor plug domain-containing protein [Limnobacter sp.]
MTVLTKEAIQDSGQTDLADVLRAQPGITIGTGEGGNAFGDRFIIRGFEARNDVFSDGLRDPGVTVRETFGLEQVEVSKGPSSSFAGRGTTGAQSTTSAKNPPHWISPPQKSPWEPTAANATPWTPTAI